MMHPTPGNNNQLLLKVIRCGVVSGLAIGGVWCMGSIAPSYAQLVGEDPATIFPSPTPEAPPEASVDISVEALFESESISPSPQDDPAALRENSNAPREERESPRAGLASSRTTPPSSNAANSVRDWYQLNRGDRISIEVFDAPEYSGDHEIFSDGTVSIPTVGTFQLRGLTLAQAETLISNRLSQILRRPFTTVRLLEERPLNLAVTGEVNEPGSYTLSAAEFDGVPTVTKAIQLAQGIRLTADIRNIEVRRTNPYTNRVDEIFVADLWQLLEEGDLSQDIPLEDGDSIVIPEADELSYDEVNVLAYANISPDEMTVNVVGEVVAPGAIQVKPNTPLHQAILAAGGFDSNRAKKKKVLLVRLNPDGTVLNQEIEIDFEQGIDTATNPPLRPFDTIVVGRSNFTRVTDILGQALSPISQFLGVLRIFGL